MARARYGKAAQKSVERAVHKEKRGTLRSGKTGTKVRSRKQAIAIGLSEARKKGARVPPPQVVNAAVPELRFEDRDRKHSGAAKYD